MTVRKIRRQLRGAMRHAACSLVLAGLLTTYPAGQAQQPVVKTTTTGVVIDVSVLDDKGRPIPGLVPVDFEVSEDGVKQQILSVSFVQAGVSRAQSGQVSMRPPASTAVTPPGGASSPAATAQQDADNTPSVTAILFDRLSPEARPLAARAALAYVSTLSSQHDYAGVFLADTALQTFQSFTNQSASLRQAVDRVAATAPTNLTPAAERSRNTRIQDVDPNQPVTPGAESDAGWVNAMEREKRLNAAGPAGPFKRMELRMWEGYQQFLAEYEGQSSLAGLRSVVNGLGLVPGRKSILYFTENLPVTARLKTKFDELIGAANRANITVYSVDAAGLRVHSKEAEVARNVNVAGTQGVGDARRDDGAWTKELERQEQLLSSRPAAALGRLSKETGGFLLENTNELAAGVARMRQEQTTYYLVAYQPTNTALDGKFRKVSVKVKRQKVTVRARPGYLALRQP